MVGGERLPVVSITGKKNSGKTTLVVALAAELRRRGRRVATVKHGHHAFEIDQPGRDSWRHFHEGEAEAVLIAGADRIALVMRTTEGEDAPEGLIRRLLSPADYDIVLVEGYKRGPFAKIEIFRSEVHEAPIHDPEDGAAAATYLAIVTDDLRVNASCRLVPLDRPGPRASHVQELADLLERRISPHDADAD